MPSAIVASIVPDRVISAVPLRLRCGRSRARLFDGLNIAATFARTHARRCVNDAEVRERRRLRV